MWVIVSGVNWIHFKVQLFEQFWTINQIMQQYEQES